MNNKFNLYNNVNEYCFIALKSVVLTKILFICIINKINFLCVLYVLVIIGLQKVCKHHIQILYNSINSRFLYKFIQVLILINVLFFF